MKVGKTAMTFSGKVALKRRSSSVRERDDEITFPKVNSKSRHEPKNTKQIGEFARKNRKSVKKESLKKSFCEGKKEMSRKTKINVLKSRKRYSKNSSRTIAIKQATRKTATKFGTIFQIKGKSKTVLPSREDSVNRSFSPKSKVDPTPSTTVNCAIFPRYTLTTRSALRISGGTSGKLFEGLPNKSRSANNKCSEKKSEQLKSEPPVLSLDHHKEIIKKSTSRWHTTRGHREASLNASVKVRLLYESNARGNWTKVPSNLDRGDLLCENRKWDYRNISGKRKLSNNVTKAKNMKQQNEKLQHPISGVGIASEEVFDARSCKRMANLNAQTILCAGYSQEPWRREKIETVYPTVDVQCEIGHFQEERLEAFSVHSSITDSTKEHEMRVTTCNTRVVVTPHNNNNNNDETVRFDKVATSVRNKKNAKLSKILNLPNNQLSMKRQNNHIEPLESGPVAMIPVSSTSERSSTTLGKVGVTEYTEVTNVHINARKEVGVKEETGPQKTTECILSTDDVAVARMRHFQTNAASQRYRFQMETTCKPNLTTQEFSPSVRQKQKSQKPVFTAVQASRPVMRGTQNFYSYSTPSPVVSVSSPKSFRNGLNNMVEMEPASSYEHAFSVPHFGQTPSMPYTPSEYNGYYQPAGSIIQPVLDPYLVHKPVLCHPTRRQHFSKPAQPPQPRNHYSMGKQCLSQHVSASSCLVEPTSQPRSPQKFTDNPSHCFSDNVPHDIPSLSYHTLKNTSHKAKPLPLFQENAPQNNNYSPGYSQDQLPLNAQQLIQNDSTDSPRLHYPQDLVTSKNVPPHGFIQDPHYCCSRHVSDYKQTPKQYSVPSDVLPPNNPTSGFCPHENSLVLPQQHEKLSPSCHSLPQLPTSAHSNFHGSLCGTSSHCQSHISPVQQHPKRESIEHQGKNLTRNYSPDLAYHELTPMIIERPKGTRTQMTKPTSPEVSFLSVPKAEPVGSSEAIPYRQNSQHSSNKHNIRGDKIKFPRSDTDKAVAVKRQCDCEAPPCSNPCTLLIGRLRSSLEKELPICLPRQDTPNCSTPNGNRKTLCTPNHRKQNFVNHTLASEKTKELKNKRRTKKRASTNQNSSSNNKTLKGSLKECEGSFQVVKASKTKMKRNQSKTVNYVIKQEHQVTKRRGTKVKLSNKSARRLKLNGSLPLSKRELSRKYRKKKYSNGWSWDGSPFQKLVFLSCKTREKAASYYHPPPTLGLLFTDE
ncbi:uncharacterized protein LOC143229333 isoform X2 [Tachypleus tridentatus]|uniref:uncharacterized protein LOC143229333 isoform X2 n=1 Tax=Tachypleus tridentatus TaxID=6853 RepID=UPI003FD11667